MPGNKLFSFFPRAASLMPAAAFALALLAPQHQAWAFNFEDVATQAKTLAAAPYKKPKGELPKGHAGSAAFLPTGDFDAWSAQPAARRWAGLARVWIDSTRAAHATA